MEPNGIYLNACMEIWGVSGIQYYDIESDDMDQEWDESVSEFKDRVHKKVDEIFDEIEKNEKQRKNKYDKQKL